MYELLAVKTEDSFRMIYKNTTRIRQSKQFNKNGNVNNYELLDEEIPLGGHPYESHGDTDLIRPHPDGYCSALALSALAPITYESAQEMVYSNWFRIEHQSMYTKIVPVYDPKKTYLNYIEVNLPGQSFR